jgi:tetratricopeptide (TPR) repeat protein
MMKLFLIIILFNLSLHANGKEKEYARINPEVLETIRLNYYASVEDENFVEETEKLIAKHFSANSDNYPNLIMAYIAAFESVKSKHAFWPFTKLKYFNSSMEMFEKVIAKDPDNLEIRFLRYAILEHVPSFLGHSKERYEDAQVIYKQLLLNDYSHIKQDIQKGIAEFLLRSERLSKEQENILVRNFSLVPGNE